VTGFKERAILLAATGGGCGYFPKLPGTIGTLAAVPLSLALNQLAKSHFVIAALILAATIPCSIWVATRGAAIVKQKDPQIIVIDEIVGFLLTNFSAPAGLTVLLAGFFLFRLFDIIKPFPANRLEKLPAGSGIVMDDVMAGVYAFLGVRLLLYMGFI
jgi:phosphatidylglycerophosphatase A